MNTIIDKINKIKSLIDDQIMEIDNQLKESDRIVVGTSISPEIDDMFSMKFKVPLDQQPMFFAKISSIIPEKEFEILQDGDGGVVEIIVSFDESEVISHILGAQFAFNINSNDVEIQDPTTLFSINKYTSSDNIGESIIKKKVVRDGKKIIKRSTTRTGYKIVDIDGKPSEVKMNKDELRNRSKAAKKSSKQKTGVSKRLADIKRKKSMKRK